MGAVQAELQPFIHACQEYTHAHGASFCSLAALADSMQFVQAILSYRFRSGRQIESGADLGSGLGFPAIPINTMLGIPMTLFEAHVGRGDFLKGLKRPDVTVREMHVRHNIEFDTRFDFVTARCFATLTFARLVAANMLRDGGLLLYAGTEDSPRPDNSKWRFMSICQLDSKLYLSEFVYNANN